MFLDSAKIDLDYESRLFTPHYDEKSSKKSVSEWEYVFFLIRRSDRDRVLKNIRDYSPGYIRRLQTLGFENIALDPCAESFHYFWGHHHNPEIEKLLNSKLTSAEIARTNGWGFLEGMRMSLIPC